MAFLLIVLLIWGVVIGAWWMMSNASRSSDIQKMKSRLTLAPKEKKAKKTDGKSPALFEAEGPAKATIVIGLLKRYELSEKIETLFEQAGLKWKLHNLVYYCMAGFIGGYAVGYLFFPDFLKPYAVVAALAASALPFLHVLRCRAKRLKAFEEVFPDVLEFVSRSMRAGHAFSVALEMIHREFADPISTEFKRAFEEHNLGLPLDVALEKLAERVPSLDVHFFVSAVLLQKRTGGNLAEILDKLAYVIRERFKLRGRIKAISAHGRMTGLTLTTIPLGVGVMMFFTNPDYITFFFTDTTGNIMAGIAIALQIVGFLIIKKIVNIEV